MYDISLLKRQVTQCTKFFKTHPCTMYVPSFSRCCVSEEQHLPILEGTGTGRRCGGGASLLHSRGGQDTHQRECNRSRHSGPDSDRVGTLDLCIVVTLVNQFKCQVTYQGLYSSVTGHFQVNLGICPTNFTT